MKEFVEITTNGTTRRIPADEPVFLLRAQDMCAADTVRYWADKVERLAGEPTDLARSAREHAKKMDAWPIKKVPDMK